MPDGLDVLIDEDSEARAQGEGAEEQEEADFPMDGERAGGVLGPHAGQEPVGEGAGRELHPSHAGRAAAAADRLASAASESRAFSSCNRSMTCMGLMFSRSSRSSSS
jgi:hypothetical protein